MSRFATILSFVMAQEKPNFTQAQLAIQKHALVLEVNAATQAELIDVKRETTAALFLLLTYMEQKFNLEPMSALLDA
jgi:hypothetical protein